MNKMLRVLMLLAMVLPPAAASGQTFGALGTRAAGMGGAFVAVADDASAIYWNPAGLAAGSYFSLVVDGGKGQFAPKDLLSGGEDSSFLLGLAVPALGVSYYRLQATTVASPPASLPADAAASDRDLSVPGQSRQDTLITHHGGLTLVQSLWRNLAAGTTLKLVRGVAASATVPGSTPREVLDHPVDLVGHGSNHFDLDAGLMAVGGPLKLGLTVRNITEPNFETASGTKLVLERQARAGVAYKVAPKWVAAADFDLLKTHDAFGERRDIALGVEGHFGARAQVRSGVAVNTVDVPGDGASRQAFSVGGSYAVRGAIFVDGHYTSGNDRAGHEWGLAARFVY